MPLSEPQPYPPAEAASIAQGSEAYLVDIEGGWPPALSALSPGEE